MLCSEGQLVQTLQELTCNEKISWSYDEEGDCFTYSKGSWEATISEDKGLSLFAGGDSSFARLTLYEVGKKMAVLSGTDVGALCDSVRTMHTIAVCRKFESVLTA